MLYDDFAILETNVWNVYGNVTVGSQGLMDIPANTTGDLTTGLSSKQLFDVTYSQLTFETYKMTTTGTANSIFMGFVDTTPTANNSIYWRITSNGATHRLYAGYKLNGVVNELDLGTFNITNMRNLRIKREGAKFEWSYFNASGAGYTTRSIAATTLPNTRSMQVTIYAQGDATDNYQMDSIELKELKLELYNNETTKAYITIYDYASELADLQKNGLSILTQAYDIKISKKLNGIGILEFTHVKDTNMNPADDSDLKNKTQHIEVEAICKINNEFYIIRKLAEEKGSDGIPVFHVYAEHIISELLDKLIISVNQTTQTCQTIANALLAGTRWVVDASAIGADTKSLLVVKSQALKGIQDLCNLFYADIFYDKTQPFRIILKPSEPANPNIGELGMVSFRYNKNMTSVKRDIDTSNVITRVWCFPGPSGTGTPFSVDATSTYPYYYKNKKEGMIEFETETNNTVIQNFAKAYLARMNQPKIVYEMNITELKHITKYKDTEVFDCGERVHVYDEDLGMDYFTQIVEYDEDPDSPDDSKVVLTNFVERITNYIADIDERLRKLE